jgi:hypothetical protein
MKTDMKGWFTVVVCVFLIGLSANTFAQHGYSKHGKSDRGNHDKRISNTKSSTQDAFSNHIYRVTEADSLQKMKMKPVLAKTSKRLESLRLSYQKQEKRVMDSLSLQMKPILKEDQLKRLDDYNYHRQERMRKK